MKKLFLILLILLSGCKINLKGDDMQYSKQIQKEYILNFWKAFKKGDFKQLENYYNDEVILLPRAMLSLKSLGISNNYSYEAKKYSKNDIFKAYSNLKQSLGGDRKWKYLFSDKNMNVSSNNMELSLVKNSKYDIKPYVLHKSVNNIMKISPNDTVFVVRGEQKNGKDKLIFVFSKDNHKIIAQTIILVLAGSHYFDGFKN